VSVGKEVWKTGRRVCLSEGEENGRAEGMVRAEHLVSKRGEEEAKPWSIRRGRTGVGGIHVSNGGERVYSVLGSLREKCHRSLGEGDFGAFKSDVPAPYLKGLIGGGLMKGKGCRRYPVPYSGRNTLEQMTGWKGDEGTWNLAD